MTFLVVLIAALALCFSYSSYFKIFVCKLQNGRTCDNNGDLTHMKRGHGHTGVTAEVKRGQKKTNPMTSASTNIIYSKERPEGKHGM